MESKPDSDGLIDAYVAGKKILEDLPGLVEKAVQAGEPRRDAIYRLITPSLDTLRQYMTPGELAEDMEHERITDLWRAQYAAAHPENGDQ